MFPIPPNVCTIHVSTIVFPLDFVILNLFQKSNHFLSLIRSKFKFFCELMSNIFMLCDHMKCIITHFY